MTPNARKNYICISLMLFYSLGMQMDDSSESLMSIPWFVVMTLSIVSLCIPIKSENYTSPKPVSLKKIVSWIFWIVAIPTFLLTCCALIFR